MAKVFGFSKVFLLACLIAFLIPVAAQADQARIQRIQAEYKALINDYSDAVNAFAKSRHAQNKDLWKAFEEMADAIDSIEDVVSDLASYGLGAKDLDDLLGMVRDMRKEIQSLKTTVSK